MSDDVDMLADRRLFSFQFAIAVAIATPVLAPQPSSGADTPSTSMRAVWTEDASRVSAAGPAGGRWVSLMVNGRNGDLAVRDLRTGTTRNLTEQRAEDASRAIAETSCVSPDGKFVAYAWNVDGREPLKAYDLRVMPTDGGPPRVLASGLPWLAPFAWMPDGKSLLVVTSDAVRPKSEQDAIEVVQLSDGSRRTVLRFSFPPGAFPSLSRDGRMLAMQKRRPGSILQHEIHLIDVASGASTSLPPPGG